MAPVAGMLKDRGFHVTGSDVNVYPPASTLLDSLGIHWNEGYRAENLKPAPDLVVVGNAISRGNAEVEHVLDEKIRYCSMPQVLEEYFIPGHTSIVVAGTHGKTTTTAMLAWIFQVAGRRPDFLIGGVAPNFGERSYGLGGGEEFIIEGDEYDTAFFDRGPKFLHYHPDELILTSLEFDHADIFPDLASIALQFRRLVNLVPRRGRILIWGESPDLKEVVSQSCSARSRPSASRPAATGARETFSGMTTRRNSGSLTVPTKSPAFAYPLWAATMFSTRWPRSLSLMGEVLNARQSRKRLLHFKACAAAWR